MELGGGWCHWAQSGPMVGVEGPCARSDGGGRRFMATQLVP